MVTAAQNPFRVERLHSLPYQAPGFAWPALLKRLEAQRYRGAILGPHGNGKTTLMRDLAKRVEALGFRSRVLFLNDERPRLPEGQLRELAGELGGKDVVFLDGADHLGVWAWRRFLGRVRRAKGLVITTHTPGRLPALYACGTSPGILDSLLDHLIPEDAGALRNTAHRLFRQYNGDIRQVMFALYDVCAS